MMDRFSAALYEQLFARHRELSSSVRNLAAPFATYVPPEYMCQRKRVLYVGKATAGPFRTDECGKIANYTLEDRKSFAGKIFAEKVGKTGPSFWGFANDVSRALDPSCSDLANLAWSNLCKLGVTVGNPDDDLISKQSDLAQSIVRREIEDLNPSIVVFVSANFADAILRNALGVFDSDFYKAEDCPVLEVSDIWWLPRTRRSPPVVWMRHPQGSSRELRLFALAKTIELCGA